MAAGVASAANSLGAGNISALPNMMNMGGGVRGAVGAGMGTLSAVGNGMSMGMANFPMGMTGMMPGNATLSVC